MVPAAAAEEAVEAADAADTTEVAEVADEEWLDSAVVSDDDDDDDDDDNNAGLGRALTSLDEWCGDVVAVSAPASMDTIIDSTLDLRLKTKTKKDGRIRFHKNIISSDD